MSGKREVFEHTSRVFQYERDRNVAGLIQELSSDVRGRSKISIPRADAALALGRLRELQAVPHLLQLANDPEPFVRMSMYEALGVMKAKAAEGALVDGLKDPDPVPRMAAAEALGRVGATEAIPALRDLLDSDLNAEVRLHTVESLVLLGDKPSRERVPQVLKAVGWRVRGHPRWKRLGKVVEAGEPLTPWFDAGG